MKEEQSHPIELDELLAAEFNYIAQTAAQANEDRARVSSFYLIAVGSLIAALFSTQLFDPEKFTRTVNLTFGGIFVLLTILGASTVMQLAQLRSAWHESMLAMNQIKDFAVSQSPELVGAFRWTTQTLPRKYKRGSVSYYQALEVAMIGGLMFGAAAYFLQRAFLPASLAMWILCALLGGAAAWIQMRIYRRLLT